MGLHTLCERTSICSRWPCGATYASCARSSGSAIVGKERDRDSMCVISRQSGYVTRACRSTLLVYSAKPLA
eukprot:2298874-Prymnesium_polylepis.1